MGVEKTGDWTLAYALCNDRLVRRQFLDEMQRELLHVGQGIAKHIRKSIDDGGLPGHRFTPLHGFTIGMKGHGAPLIDSGNLRREIGAHEIAPLKVFVGVASSRAVSFGSDISYTRLAEILENGIYIPMTPKMRGWLGAHGFFEDNVQPNSTRGDGEPGYIHIPGRPLIMPYFRSQRLRRIPENELFDAAGRVWWAVVNKAARHG